MSVQFFNIEIRRKKEIQMLRYSGKDAFRLIEAIIGLFRYISKYSQILRFGFELPADRYSRSVRNTM